MIIKITSKTRRISISGTTFGSAVKPRLPPTCIPMSHLAQIACERTLTSGEENLSSLLSCLEFCRDQANLVDSGAAHNIDSARDVHEHRFVVALHKSDFFGPFLKDLLDARTQLIPAGIFLVDFDFAVL